MGIRKPVTGGVKHCKLCGAEIVGVGDMCLTCRRLSLSGVSEATCRVARALRTATFKVPYIAKNFSWSEYVNFIDVDYASFLTVASESMAVIMHEVKTRGKVVRLSLFAVRPEAIYVCTVKDVDEFINVAERWRGSVKG